MKLITPVLLLVLLSISVSALSVAIEQPDCSHIQVTTDPGAYVDILYNGDQGWGPIYSGEKADSNGKVIKPAIFNGTHKATAGTFPGRVSASSSSIQITTCAPPKPCTSKSDCSTGEACISGFCSPGECGSNSDCPDSKSCDVASHSCVAVPCACGTTANHICAKYQCCSDANCTGGKICVNHNCVANNTGSPGGTGDQTDPAKASAQSAISDAQSAINAAKAQGKDVAAAEAILSQANSKFASADYSTALNLALSAKQSAQGVGGTTGGSNTGSNGGAGNSGGEQNWLSSGVGLACVGGVALFFIFVIGLFIVVALAAMLFKRK